jgi:hypothetical protein
MPVAQKQCWCEHGVLQAECVFILKHYFASKSFAAVCRTYTSVYPDKEGPYKTGLTGNKSLVYRKCLSVTSACQVTKSLTLWSN